MKEVWKPVKGYEGLYEVSNLGRVKNSNGKILRHSDNGHGYLTVSLCKESKQKTFYVHRLVATAFIPNGNNYPQVNHKDENTSNNKANNLEWCTQRYNNVYGTRTSKFIKARGNKVICVETQKRYESYGEAARDVGADRSAIMRACRQNHRMVKGYHWEYERGKKSSV